MDLLCSSSSIPSPKKQHFFELRVPEPADFANRLKCLTSTIFKVRSQKVNCLSILFQNNQGIYINLYKYESRGV